LAEAGEGGGQFGWWDRNNAAVFVRLKSGKNQAVVFGWTADIGLRNAD
jgi:hypothetical protein